MKYLNSIPVEAPNIRQAAEGADLRPDLLDVKGLTLVTARWFGSEETA